MSECILCKGMIPHKIENVVIVSYPFCNFYNKVCNYFWNSDDKKDIWTIEIEGGHLDIDDYFTEAQVQIGFGLDFENSKIYKIIKEILKNNVEIIMWYSDFYEDIPVALSEEQLFNEVFNGITDKRGMCEVYVRFKNFI